MPVTIKSANGKYIVSTPGGVKSKGTSKKSAEAQKRLLLGIEHGWKPGSRQRRATKTPDSLVEDFKYSQLRGGK